MTYNLFVGRYIDNLKKKYTLPIPYTYDNSNDLMRDDFHCMKRIGDHSIYGDINLDTIALLENDKVYDVLRCRGL